MYNCNVYGLKDPALVHAMDVNKKDLTLLTKAQIISDESNKKGSILDKLGLWSIVITIVVGSLLFMFYMNYKSARLAYKWTFGFIENKTLYKGYHNLEYALDKDASYSEAYLLMAKINIYTKQYEVAAKQLEKVSPSTKDEKQSVLYLKGYCQYKLKHNQKAVEDLSALVQAYPSSSGLDSAYQMLGELHAAQKEYSKALNDFGHMKYKDNHVLYMEAVNLLVLEKYTESNKLLSKLIKEEKHPSSDLLYHQGLCLLYLQDTTAACQWLNLASQRDHAQAQQLKGDWCATYLNTPE